MDMEEFKDIKEYEGLYQVSSLGRVKSLKDNHGGYREKILKGSKDKDGYLIVSLCKEGKPKKYRVHRLVAEAFIDNPHNYPCVNHKDENKANNCVGNLEFCTVKYNNTYGTVIQRRVANTDYKAIVSKIDYKARTAKIDWKELSRKRVANTDYKARTAKIDYKEVSRKRVANTDYKARTAKIDYKEVSRKRVANTDYKSIARKLSKRVLQFTKDNEFVREWSSTNECGRNGFDHSAVAKCCKGKLKSHKGFIWKYK